MLVRARYIGKPIKHYKVGGLYILNLKDGVMTKAITNRVDLSSSTQNHLLRFDSMDELLTTWENISVLKSIEIKVCKNCNKLKNIDQFYSSPKNKDGHRGNCIECDRKRSRKSMKKLHAKWKKGGYYKCGGKIHYYKLSENK